MEYLRDQRRRPCWTLVAGYFGFANVCHEGLLGLYGWLLRPVELYIYGAVRAQKNHARIYDPYKPVFYRSCVPALYKRKQCSVHCSLKNIHLLVFLAIFYLLLGRNDSISDGHHDDDDAALMCASDSPATYGALQMCFDLICVLESWR